VTATLSAKVERKDEDSLGQCFWTCSIPNSSGHLVAYTHQESVTQREFEERKVGDFRTLLYDPKYPTRRIFYDDGDYEVVPQNR
jgi:hypothetical protein